jgi:hypothetical protein
MKRSEQGPRKLSTGGKNPSREAHAPRDKVHGGFEKVLRVFFENFRNMQQLLV